MDNNITRYDEVSLIAHGGMHASSIAPDIYDKTGNIIAHNELVVENSDYFRNLSRDKQNDVVKVEDLTKTNADINLLICNAGHLNHQDDNLAQAFDSITTGNITASDGSVSFYSRGTSIANYLATYALFPASSVLMNVVADTHPYSSYEPRLSREQDHFHEYINIQDENAKDREPEGFYTINDGERIVD